MGAFLELYKMVTKLCNLKKNWSRNRLKSRKMQKMKILNVEEGENSEDNLGRGV